MMLISFLISHVDVKKRRIEVGREIPSISVLHHSSTKLASAGPKYCPHLLSCGIRPTFHAVVKIPCDYTHTHTHTTQHNKKIKHPNVVIDFGRAKNHSGNDSPSRLRVLRAEDVCDTTSKTTQNNTDITSVQTELCCWFNNPSVRAF